MKCNYELIDKLLKNYDYLNGMIKVNYSTLKGVDYKPTKIETNETSDITADKVIKILEETERINRIRMIFDKIEKSLDYLKEYEKKVIEKFYFEKKGWINVGIELGYSSRQCQRIKKKAIKKIYNFCFLDKTGLKDIKFLFAYFV